jgi:hypothetical protein
MFSQLIMLNWHQQMKKAGVIRRFSVRLSDLNYSTAGLNRPGKQTPLR